MKLNVAALNMFFVAVWHHIVPYLQYDTITTTSKANWQCKGYAQRIQVNTGLASRSCYRCCIKCFFQTLEEHKGHVFFGYKREFLHS